MSSINRLNIKNRLLVNLDDIKHILYHPNITEAEFNLINTKLNLILSLTSNLHDAYSRLEDDKLNKNKGD